MVGWAEMPRSPGHVFYDRLQSVLIEGGFDSFAEAACRSYYAARLGAPSVPPGRYFRMHLVGYFEGIDSERGLEWRCSDSLSLREFLRLESRDRVPDHSGCHGPAPPPRSTRRSSTGFLIAEAGLVKGERIGVDASTMETRRCATSCGGTRARVTGGCWRAWPRRAASRHPRPRTRAWTASARARSSRTRTGFEERQDRQDEGRHDPSSVDLDTGAVVAAELHPADEGDTTTLEKTLAAAKGGGGRGTDGRRPGPEGFTHGVLKALDDGPWKTRRPQHGDGAARRASAVIGRSAFLRPRSSSAPLRTTSMHAPDMAAGRENSTYL